MTSFRFHSQDESTVHKKCMYMRITSKESLKAIHDDESHRHETISDRNITMVLEILISPSQLWTTISNAVKINDGMSINGGGWFAIWQTLWCTQLSNNGSIMSETATHILDYARHPHCSPHIYPAIDFFSSRIRHFGFLSSSVAEEWNLIIWCETHISLFYLTRIAWTYNG